MIEMYAAQHDTMLPNCSICELHCQAFGWYGLAVRPDYRYNVICSYYEDDRQPDRRMYYIYARATPKKQS
jgi:elongation factor P hydroxylase